MTKKIIWLTILSLLALGCSFEPRVSLRQPNMPEYVFDAGLARYTTDWQREVSRRYDDFVMVSGHGTALAGKWFIVTDAWVWIDVQEWADLLHAVHPEARIVITSCNPGRIPLTTPNVTYATDNVWAVPDAFVSKKMNKERDAPDDNIGSIFEFTEN